MKENKNIKLRAFEPDDYILINKWRNDPQIQKLTSGTFRYVSSEREKEWVKEKIDNDRTNIYLAICLIDNPKEMIGYISINNIDYIHRTAFGGGIVIGDKKYRDGTTLIDTWQIILSYVFDTLNLNRFSAACLSEHTASQIMLKALYFQNEGTLRQVIYKDGNYHDQLIFSLLRNEYYEFNKNHNYELISLARRIKTLKKKL